MNKDIVSDIDWLYDQMSRHRGRGMSSDESRIFIGGWCAALSKMREKAAGDLKEKAEPELSRPHASYDKDDMELLLKLLQRLSKNIDDTNLPQDPRSRRFVVDLWRAQLTGYRQILAAMVETRGGGGHGGGTVGGRGDDSPICRMPYLDKTKLPANTMKLPGPSKRPKQ